MWRDNDIKCGCVSKDCVYHREDYPIFDVYGKQKNILSFEDIVKLNPTKNNPVKVKSLFQEFLKLELIGLFWMFSLGLILAKNYLKKLR